MQVREFLTKVKWWHLLLVTFLGSVLALVLIAFLIRWNGLAEAKQTAVDLRTNGYLPTESALLASLPVLDDERQRVYRVAEKSLAIYNVQEFHSRVAEDWITSDGVMPTSSVALVEGHRERLANVREILRAGGVVLGSAEGVRRQLAAGGETALANKNERVALWTLSAYLRLAALAGDVQALGDLDALHVATAKPVFVNDLMYGSGYVDNVRDQTYVDLALLGRLPPAAAQAWLAEPFNGQRQLAACMRRDLVSQARYAEGSELANMNAVGGYGWRTTISNFSYWSSNWLFAGKDYAAFMRMQVATAQRLVRTGTPAVRTEDFFYSSAGGMWGISPIMWARMATGMGTRHRLARLAVRVIELQRRLGEVPPDSRALILSGGDPALLKQQGDLPALAYKRHHERHFCITIDPSVPVPTLVEMPPMWFADTYRAYLPAMASYSSSTVPRPYSIANDHIELRIPQLSPTVPSTGIISPAPQDVRLPP